MDDGSTFRCQLLILTSKYVRTLQRERKSYQTFIKKGYQTFIENEGQDNTYLFMFYPSINF